MSTRTAVVFDEATEEAIAEIHAVEKEVLRGTDGGGTASSWVPRLAGIRRLLQRLESAVAASPQPPAAESSSSAETRRAAAAAAAAAADRTATMMMMSVPIVFTAVKSLERVFSRLLANPPPAPPPALPTATTAGDAIVAGASAGANGRHQQQQQQQQHLLLFCYCPPRKLPPSARGDLGQQSAAAAVWHGARAAYVDYLSTLLRLLSTAHSLPAVQVPVLDVLMGFVKKESLLKSAAAAGSSNPNAVGSGSAAEQQSAQQLDADGLFAQLVPHLLACALPSSSSSSSSSSSAAARSSAAPTPAPLRPSPPVPVNAQLLAALRDNYLQPFDDLRYHALNSLRGVVHSVLSELQQLQQLQQQRRSSAPAAAASSSSSSSPAEEPATAAFVSSVFELLSAAQPPDSVSAFFVGQPTAAADAEAGAGGSPEGDEEREDFDEFELAETAIGGNRKKRKKTAATGGSKSAAAAGPTARSKRARQQQEQQPATAETKKKKKPSGASDIGAQRKAFSQCWLALLKLPLPVEIYKRVLVRLHKYILPHFSQPQRLMDFLKASSYMPGVISILALNGLFVLMTQYNLDYPAFYTRLYQLFEPSLFVAKYRNRFFELANLFLSSTHLPAYLVAAFVKRCARLALVAPPAGCLVLLVFMHRLLQRHPACRVLIHREPKVAAKPVLLIGQTAPTSGFSLLSGVDSADPTRVNADGVDPYVFDEADPANCRALESSLWELQSLAVHYSPTVSQFVKAFQGDFDGRNAKTFQLDEFLNETYQSMFDAELNRKTKGVAALSFDKVTGLFQNGSVWSAWSFDT